MKKLLAVFLSAMFVLGLAAAAYAVNAEVPSETQVVAKGATKVTIGGSVRVRGETRSNTADLMDKQTLAPKTWNNRGLLPTAAGDDRRTMYDERVRLSVDAKPSDQAQAFIMLETGGGMDDVYTWGTNGTGATGLYRDGNSKNTSLGILEAWLLYKPGGWGIKAGHMPLALGNKMFFDHTKFGDDALVIFADPNEAVHVGALTAKFSENGLTADDDDNAYVVLATYKSSAFNASADITLVDNQNAGTSATYSARKTAQPVSHPAAIPAGSALAFYNIGLRGNASVGPVKIGADVEMQTGKAKDVVLPNWNVKKAKFVDLNGQDMDFSGNAIMINAGMDVGTVGLNLEVGRGSGNELADPRVTAKTGVRDTKTEAFVTSLSPGIAYYAFLYGPRVVTAAGATNTGMANTTYVKLAGKVKVGETTIDAALLSLSATEDLAIVEDAAANFKKSGIFNKRNDGDGTCEKGETCFQPKKDAGMELDATVTVPLTKGLKYWVEGGYLMTGDMYKGMQNSSLAKVDDAYAVRHGIEISY